MIKNYMENIVFEKLDQTLSSLDSCTCENCRQDIAAIVLNNLPPKYVASREVYAKLNMLRFQFEVDVMTQITKAAAIVAQNPRHDE